MNPIETLLHLLEHENVPFQNQSLARYQFLKTPQSCDTNLYYIVKGSVRAYIQDEDEEHTIRLGYTGNFIAALDSYITEQPSQLAIQALKKTEVRKYKKVDYVGFVESNNEAKQLWLHMQEMLIYTQLEREVDILTASPKTRYERVLKRSPQLFQEIPLRYIASYLRMTPETLSRLRKS